MDRLKELKSNLGPEETESERVGLAQNSASSSATSSSSSNPQMAEFYSYVDRVRENINQIATATENIKILANNYQQATTTDQESSQSEKVEELVKSTNKKANLTKQILEKMKESTITGNCKSSELRIQENLTSTLTRKFVDIIKNYQLVQTNFKNEIKIKAKRQVKIVYKNATEEEVETILKAGGSSGEVYKEAFMTGSASQAVENIYQSACEKYQEVLMLEASVSELHQMFLDFALLTDRQGELLDQIEHQVKTASDYVDEGNKEMVQAIDYQKSIRKKQCCCIAIVLIIVIIIVAVLMAKFA